MATRCQIKIICKEEYEGKTYTDEILLYRYWDGYPESIIPFFKRFFETARFGYDTHLNCAGQISHALIIFGYRDDVRIEPTNEIYGDIEYYYELLLNRNSSLATINIYELDWNEEKGYIMDFENKRLIKSIEIELKQITSKESGGYKHGLPIESEMRISSIPMGRNPL